MDQLDSMLASDKALRDAFAKYQETPHPIHLISNIFLGGMSDEEVNRLASVCDSTFGPRVREGLKIPEVLKLLAENDLIKYQSINPNHVTLQLRCLDHEVDLNEFVFRQHRLLDI